MPTVRFASLHRERDLQIMRDAMRRAGVPETKVDDVVQAEEEVEYGIGYVWDIWTTVSQTIVIVDGYRGSLGPMAPERTNIHFPLPPNPPAMLAEFVRAQSHPHLLVRCDWTQGRLRNLEVRLDHFEQPLQNAPEPSGGKIR